MARGRKAAASEAGPVEGRWPLPDGWEWRAAGDVLPLAYGKALSAKVRHSHGTIPVFGSSGKVGVHSESLIPGPAVIVGRKGSAGAVHYSSGPSWPIDTAFYCVGSETVDIQFGFRLLTWLGLNRLDQSTAIPSLSRDSYDPLPVPIPPLETQRRIVARIDELFTELEDGETALASAKVDLETYRKSLLKAAVTGELTADWRATNRPQETGEQLLQRILAERKARWEAQPKNRAKSFSRPIEPPDRQARALPPSWTSCTIDQLVRVVRGASPRPAGDPRFFGGNIPWITVGSLTADENRYLEAVGLFVTEAGKQASRYVEPETLLFTNSGATLGVPKITRVGGCINDGSVALLDVHEPTKSFLYFFLSTQTEPLRALNQGAAQPNLNTTIVRNIVVPLPPLDEQERIVDLLVNTYRRELIEPDIRHLGASSSVLRQSILSAAFRGELVQ